MLKIELDKKITSSKKDEFLKLLKKFRLIDISDKKINISAPTRSEIKIIKDLDESYDKRSTWDVVRDNESGLITKYSFKIFIRDENDFIGELTRDQIETIYAQYPYVTQKTVSQYFPYLTFPQFKRIVRCFNITKDQLFPQHILEEKTESEAAQLALKHKENAAYKKFVELKPIEIEKQLRDTQLELHKLKTERLFTEDILKDYLEKIDVNILLPNQHNVNKNFDYIPSDKALILYLSDMHIGAMNKDCQYSDVYNKEVYLKRLEVILENVREEIVIHFPEKIMIIGLGDMVDGYNSTTTRGGHLLPQNMNNKEQFTTYMDSMIWFFDELTRIFSNKIEFIHVGESNHGGDFEYGANKALEHILKLKHNNQVSVRIFEKNIEHITYGVHTLICTHGKDTDVMSRNMPMHLNPNTEKYINDYITFNKIKSDSILFIKGDLHNHNSETNKMFRYVNVPSVYGGSSYTDANFSFTKPATLIHILHKNKTKLNEIYVEL